MKKLLAVVLFGSLLASSALAAGYKSAGCGLGSLVIQDDGIAQIFAATTNGTSGNQTFAITSGTSNCGGRGGFAKADAQKEMYVSANYDAITQEMAQGRGEHLNALANLMGCNDEGTKIFNNTLKKNYRTISSQATTPEALINTVEKTVATEPTLKTACNG